MKKTILIIFLSSLLPTLIADAGSNKESHIAFNGREYRGPGYTIFEPTNWTKLHGYAGFDIVLRDDSSRGYYKPNFGVMITAQSEWREWETEWNQETSSSINKKALQQNLIKMTTGEIIGEYYNVNLFWITKLKHTRELRTGKINAISLVAFTVQGGDSYMIQCNASEEDYQRYEVLFMEIIQSFKLNNSSYR